MLCNRRRMLARSVLTVDVGGSNVKLSWSGSADCRSFPSGKRLSARRMVEGVLQLARDWPYDTVSVGVPAQVLVGRVVHEPVNLGSGWAGFDYEQAFGKPTRVVNDA